MAMICCQKTNFLPSCVAHHKAVTCAQNGLFITKLTFFICESKTSKIPAKVQMQSKFSFGDELLDYKLSFVKEYLLQVFWKWAFSSKKKV